MGKQGISLGQQGETLAADALKKKGLIILERNWKCEEGELDLVAQDEDSIVFVEVKSRRSSSYGSPEEAVTRVKSTRIAKSGIAYLQEKDLLDRPWRIDVVAIEFNKQGKLLRLTHYENAITGDEVSWE